MPISYENATVWDLRQRIATEANFNIDRVRLWIKGREVHSLNNPKTMVEMNLKSDQTITANLQPTTVSAQCGPCAVLAKLTLETRRFVGVATRLSAVSPS